MHTSFDNPGNTPRHCTDMFLCEMAHSFQACISPLSRTAACKHLFSCPLLAISSNLMDYLSHFCSFTLRGLTYAGVCCPENLATLTS
ncbi:unnamed protein product [Timema podura]|uniref:Uncharacterized protein n=1 Tax=Timema podura TaxID=61482 RepID=A0ABN7PNE0_TIMPD|nr:unnamed protein product [Timema podura]